MPTLAFLDTETTGLQRARRPWEIAIIRRSELRQSRLLVCVDIDDLELESADPAGLKISGFHKRHPQVRTRPAQFPRVCRSDEAARLVAEWTEGATIVGVVPTFDTECLSAMLDRHRITPKWNPDVVDVVPLAAQRLRAAGREPASDFSGLSRQCGVSPPGAGERHTALGDARWAMRWYDRLSGYS